MFARIFIGWIVVGCTVVVADQPLAFNRDIRPILSDKCFFCHGPDAEHREADLRLDDETSAKEHAIVPGDLTSEMIARITSDDPDSLMPPAESEKHLSEEEIELLTRWVQQGAPYEAYWAYVPPQRRPAPQVDSSWPTDSIDHFILAALNREGLEPAPDADRHTLIRRVSFDLTGLPPTRDQVRAFVDDSDPMAYPKLVDRLLASPAYGERMAVYWLDLVRYADTVGYHGDQDHNISPYRDYVIDALNDDMPLDQFTREQLAGDLLPQPTIEQQIASGYNRLLQTSHEGGVQPKEYLAIYAADRVRNVSNVWMGATVGCAQCHDHKYDPYTIGDFYSMAAMFADIDEAKHFTSGTNDLPTKREPEMAVLNRAQRDRLARIESELNADPTAANRAALEGERQALLATKRWVMVTKSIEPREMRVLPRGNWMDDSGPIVDPAVPQFLGSIQRDRERVSRLDFANWLVDPSTGAGGLTARVFANRFWYLMFGRGISSSLTDFGGQGEPPTHPELLDQLAVDLIADQWSIKRFLRRVVLSHAYRQSSQASGETLQSDPYNHWFARQSRYRLPAEMVRDNLNSIGGLLVNRIGGPSVKPVQPAGYYRHLNFPKRTYTADTDDQPYRRAVYIHWQRQYLHPMLKATDAPSREECTAQRPRSNTPLEALVMLNDPSMIDAAIGLAQRVLSEGHSSTEQRMHWIFESAVSRNPEESEVAALQKLWVAELAYYQSHPDQARELLSSHEAGDPIELAAWTSVARAVMNLYESVSRN